MNVNARFRPLIEFILNLSESWKWMRAHQARAPTWLRREARGVGEPVRLIRETPLPLAR